MKAILGVVFCGAALALTGGCGGQKTYTPPEGEVTIEQRGGEGEGKIEIKGEETGATITTDEGRAEFGSGVSVTEEEVGIPFYPGATVVDSLELPSVGTQKGKGVSYQAALATRDERDKVEAYYRKQLAGSQAMVMVSEENKGEIKLVRFWRDEKAGVTQIIVLHSVKRE